VAIVDQVIGNKALTAENQLETLNREVIPVIRRLREAVNGRAGGYYAETFGDGVATSFTISHGLGTKDVLVQVYTVSSGIDATELFYPTAGGSIVRDGDDTVTLTIAFGVPAVDELRVVVRR
jgi:hypothetical protein